MRRRHHREHATFKDRQPSFPFDCQRFLQNFERIVPCAVQDVRDPEPEVGEDSRILAACALGAVHRLLPLPFERTAGGNDLFGEVLRGVGAGMWERHESEREEPR